MCSRTEAISQRKHRPQSRRGLRVIGYLLGAKRGVCHGSLPECLWRKSHVVVAAIGAVTVSRAKTARRSFFRVEQKCFCSPPGDHCSASSIGGSRPAFPAESAEVMLRVLPQSNRSLKP